MSELSCDTPSFIGRNETDDLSLYQKQPLSQGKTYSTPSSSSSTHSPSLIMYIKYVLVMDRHVTHMGFRKNSLLWGWRRKGEISDDQFVRLEHRRAAILQLRCQPPYRRLESAATTRCSADCGAQALLLVGIRTVRVCQIKAFEPQPHLLAITMLS